MLVRVRVLIIVLGLSGVYASASALVFRISSSASYPKTDTGRGTAFASDPTCTPSILIFGLCGVIPSAEVIYSKCPGPCGNEIHNPSNMNVSTFFVSAAAFTPAGLGPFTADVIVTVRT